MDARMPERERKPSAAMRIGFRGARLAGWCRVMLALLAVACLRAEDGPAFESKVKAAFLCKFPAFVEWPSTAFPSAQAPVVIGILGRDPFGPEFDQAVQGVVHGSRSVVVRRFASLQEFETCHILYVGDSEQKKLAEVLARVRGTPVLTVGDFERFAHQGGMVNFIKENGKVRFQINVEEAKKAGLRLSPKILQVSQVVNALAAGGAP